MLRWCRTAATLSMLVLIGLLGPSLGNGSASAADLSLLPRHSQTQQPNAAAKTDAELPLEAFARGPNAACTAWTDGCRSCGKGPDGVVFCSNVGIACLPSKPRCSLP
jgi:hypothetical protein